MMHYVGQHLENIMVFFAVNYNWLNAFTHLFDFPWSRIKIDAAINDFLEIQI